MKSSLRNHETVNYLQFHDRFFLGRPIAQFIFFHSLTINRITMIFLFFVHVFPFYFFNYQKVLRFLSHHHSIWNNRFEISLLKAIGNDSTCVSI